MALYIRINVKIWGPIKMCVIVCVCGCASVLKQGPMKEPGWCALFIKSEVFFRTNKGLRRGFSPTLSLEKALKWTLINCQRI